MPNRVAIPNLQYFEMNNLHLFFDRKTHGLNSRGEQLPEYLAFDK